MNTANLIRRPSISTTMLEVAYDMSRRATCIRRQVGCVLINERNHILATGYNGVAAGQVHCIDVKCPGAELPSGEGLDKCQALHAEQNALLQCRDVYEIHSAYVTTSPCVTCTKLLMNTSCQEIYFVEEYLAQPEAKRLWPGKWVRVNS